MIEHGLDYVLPDDIGTVRLLPLVLSHLNANKQRNWWTREAGGQLFATFPGSFIEVSDVTGPRPTDRRSRYNYGPDQDAEQREIRERFDRGLHFVGDWHSHPQRFPRPSNIDLCSIQTSVEQSVHDLAGFLLVIVGRAGFPKGLHVSFHSRTTSAVLKATTE